MPSMNLKVEHSLTQEEARERLQRFLELVKAQYGSHVSNLEEEWNENFLRFAFSAMGFSTSGKVTVEATEVVVDSKIPLAAMMVRGKIESTIREQLTRVLRA